MKTIFAILSLLAISSAASADSQVDQATADNFVAKARDKTVICVGMANICSDGCPSDDGASKIDDLDSNASIIRGANLVVLGYAADFATVSEDKADPKLGFNVYVSTTVGGKPATYMIDGDPSLGCSVR